MKFLGFYIDMAYRCPYFWPKFLGNMHVSHSSAKKTKRTPGRMQTPSESSESSEPVSDKQQATFREFGKWIPW